MIAARRVVLLSIVLGFFVLGSMDLGHHHWRDGVASILLGIVNGLLLL
jgi:hypothetical protein